MKDASYKSSHITWNYFCEVSRRGKSAERRKMVARGLRERAHRAEEELLMGTSFLLVVKKCPKVDYSDACTTLNILKKH